MAKGTIQVLMLGDIVGRAGLRALTLLLPNLVKKHRADLVVVNGENADDGFGISPENAHAMLNAGVDVITTGNHVWQHKHINALMTDEEVIIRPANYPGSPAGRGYTVRDVKGLRVAVMQVQGRTRMGALDCPFRRSTELLRSLKASSDLVLCDFHAEAADEKEALALYLDGRIAALVGTHTHVQTADERILPGGTAYITDLGMTGPQDSVIGFRSDVSIRRALTQLPLKNEVADSAATVQGVVLTIDSESGLSQRIVRVSEASAV